MPKKVSRLFLLGLVSLLLLWSLVIQPQLWSAAAQTPPATLTPTATNTVGPTWTPVGQLPTSTLPLPPTPTWTATASTPTATSTQALPPSPTPTFSSTPDNSPTPAATATQSQAAPASPRPTVAPAALLSSPTPDLTTIAALPRAGAGGAYLLAAGFLVGLIFLTRLVRGRLSVKNGSKKA